MLLSLEEFQRQYKADQGKLQFIVDCLAKAPAEHKANTEHIANLSLLAPYVYYTSIVRKMCKPADHILDWGAFLGQITYLLQDDFKVISYNPSPGELIDYWQEQLGIKDRLFDPGFKKLRGELKAESFDAVLSSGVLEHTFEFGMEDIEALRALQRILKPGGYLFIWNLPTRHALAEKVSITKKRWRHIKRYDLEEVLIKLNLTGFDVEAIELDELVYGKLSRLLKKNPVKAWGLDQKLARLPMARKYAHHFTIVARKVENFPTVSATSGYTTYLNK